MALKIFVNGTFDLIHRGHLELLRYAGYMGELLVAIDSDRRVKELKGPKRPIVNQDDRRYHLLSLRNVSSCIIFDSEAELEQIIKDYNPDVMVKGSDYDGHPIIGAKYCKKVLFFDRITAYATTKTIQNIIARR